MCFAPQRRAISTSQLPKVVWSWCSLYSLTWKCASRHKGVHFSTWQLPKVVRTCGVFNFFTCKCASRHNGVHFFFDMATSKSGPNVRCLLLFHLQKRFAPQRRALFRHPKVVREWGVLYILTWKCASRHNGVQFFISHLARWLRTRRFSEPTFLPCDFPTFSRTCIFFLLTLSLLWSSLFCSSLFYSSLLSDSSHLCFSSVHIVGSLTYKLPSNIIHKISKIIIESYIL